MSHFLLSLPLAGDSQGSTLDARTLLAPALWCEVDPRQIITVVSGLPRSGTSLMMQLLVTAGREALTDARRAADEDNPLGYFEFEKTLDWRRTLPGCRRRGARW